jgi:hypothetical protein
MFALRDGLGEAVAFHEFARRSPEPPPVGAAEALRDARRRLRSAAIFRSYLLGLLGLAALANGLAYLRGVPAYPSPPSPGILFLEAFGGLTVWASAWTVLGVAGLVSAALGWRAKLVVIGLACMQLWWACAFLVGWMQSGYGTGYATAITTTYAVVVTLGLLALPTDRRRVPEVTHP